MMGVSYKGDLHADCEEDSIRRGNGDVDGRPVGNTWKKIHEKNYKTEKHMNVHTQCK